MAQQTNGQQNRRPTSNPLEYGRNEFSEAHDVEVITSSAVEAQERAQIDVQIATAKRWPRGDLKRIQENIVQMATLDEETAASCFYTLKRKDRETGDDKVIQGPSVRLAEIAVVCYKNIRAAARIIENDGRQLTAQGACHDLENNVFVSKTSTRSIVNKYGKTYSQDMQVTTSNAANSIAYRNAVFGVIPGVLIKKAYEVCLRVAAGQGPIEQRFQKAVRMFSPWGIKEQQLLGWLDHENASAVTEEDIVSLRGLFNSLRDGETTVQEAFAEAAAKQQADGSKSDKKPEESPEKAVKSEPTEQNEQTEQTEQQGGLSPDMFGRSEYQNALDWFRLSGSGKTAAQLAAHMGEWNGSKEDFLADLKAKASKE